MSNPRQPALDPAVAALLDQGARRRDVRQLPQKVQAEARRQAARARYTYDLPTALQDVVVHVAAEEGLSASAVAGLLLADALFRYYDGGLTLDSRVKRPSNSPKFDYVVDDAVVLDILRGHVSIASDEERQK